MNYDAILIVSFGGPEGPDDVLPFLENVTRGRNVPRDRLEQVALQYDVFGGRSPINDQCRALCSALATELEKSDIDLPLYWGNRNWDPMLEDTVRRMADDKIEHALAFVTSATSSYSGCRQYREDIERAREVVGPTAPQIDKIRQYYDHPGFIEPMISNVAAELEQVGPHARLVFTAHSLPLSMAATSDYEAQLREASRLVAAGVDYQDFDLVWQSRSGPPRMPWLEPDINDHLEALAARGVTGVVVAPIGFISDHMEVMFDLDEQAATTARRLGLEFKRANTVGTHPRFIAGIVELIEERRKGTEPRGLGTLEIRPDFCALDCCPAGSPPTIPDRGSDTR